MLQLYARDNLDNEKKYIEKAIKKIIPLIIVKIGKCVFKMIDSFS